MFQLGTPARRGLLQQMGLHQGSASTPLAQHSSLLPCAASTGSTGEEALATRRAKGRPQEQAVAPSADRASSQPGASVVCLDRASSQRWVRYHELSLGTLLAGFLDIKDILNSFLAGA